VCEILEEAIAPDQGIDFAGQLFNETTVNGLTQRIVTNDLRNTLAGLGKPVTDKAKIFGTETSNGIVEPYYLRDTKIVCKITGTGPYKIYHLRQTLSSAEELDAAPEDVNRPVYEDVLRNAEYAFKLPFDLPHIEGKAYFERFGVSRAELMKTFQLGTGLGDEEIAAENLGLTDSERKLIAHTPILNDNAAQLAFWKTPSQWQETDSSGNTITVNGGVVDYLKRVDHFLDRTGLQYKELELLLKLRFIENNGNLFIYNNDLTCDTAKKEIKNFDLAALDRMHRFLRLQKKLQWRYETLDEVISQAGLGTAV
jgi:hypothetical protein